MSYSSDKQVANSGMRSGDTTRPRKSVVYVSNTHALSPRESVSHADLMPFTSTGNHWQGDTVKAFDLLTGCLISQVNNVMEP